MSRLLFGLTALSVLSLSCSVMAQGTSVVSPDTIKTCESCHGPGGNSTVSSTPRLNGQMPGYIIARLQDFLDLTRETTQASAAMNDIAHSVNGLNNQRPAIAEYFARQTPTPANPGSPASLGARIFASGVPADQVPACQTCHGAQAEGSGSVPRLAGQHADYLRTQLWALNEALRESNTMHQNADKLSSDQIEALVTYLAGD